MKETPFLRVLGSADWLPSKNNDGSSYLLNDRIMIDTGWSVAYNMICNDLEPLLAKLLCFTHMHADHYMGLTQLILYWRIKKSSMEGFTIAGPKETVKAGFERALDYVFHDSKDLSVQLAQLPKIIELEPGDSFQQEGYDISVISSNHAVPGLCYRFTHIQSGKVICFTGDTMYDESFGEFFKGCDVLVHEASSGGGPVDPVLNAMSKHSSAIEAVKVAKESGAKHLILTHAPVRNRKSALEVAKANLEIPVDWAIPYKVFEF